MKIADLVFDYGWRKPFTFHFQGQTQNIELVFDAYKGENVNEQQYAAYESFIKAQTDYEAQAEALLVNYMQQNQLDGQVTLRSLQFNFDGAFALLADCSWDVENGIAIVLSPEAKVTQQDNFL